MWNDGAPKYTIAHVSRKTGNLWEILTNLGASGKPSWCCFETALSIRRQDRPTDSKLRHTRFNYTHLMTTEKVRARETFLAPSHWHNLRILYRKSQFRSGCPLFLSSPFIHLYTLSHLTTTSLLRTRQLFLRWMLASFIPFVYALPLPGLFLWLARANPPISPPLPCYQTVS